MYSSSTVGIKVVGNLSLDHCASEIQKLSNNGFGRIHTLLFTSRKWKNEQVDQPIGVFHFLPEELQTPFFMTSKYNANANKRRFEDSLGNYFVKRRRKE